MLAFAYVYERMSCQFYFECVIAYIHVHDFLVIDRILRYKCSVIRILLSLQSTSGHL